MAYPPVKQPEMKYVDSEGNFVDATDERVAYQVNMDDPNALNFIDGLKPKAVSSTAKEYEGRATTKVEPIGGTSGATTQTMTPSGDEEPETGFSDNLNKKLADAGLDSPEKLSAATDEQLKDAGITGAQLTKFRSVYPAPQTNE